jgi:hypothetical protein
MLLKIRTYSTRRKCCQHLHLGYLCGSGIPAWEARTFYRWLDGWVAAGCWMGLCCTWFRCFSGDDVDGLTIFHNLSWLGNCLCIHNKHTSHEQIWFYIARILPTWMALVIGQCWQVRFFAAPDLHRNWLPGSRAARSSCLVPSFALLSTFQSEEAVWHLQFVAQPLKLCTAENGNVQPTWCWCAIEPRQFDKVMLILLLVFHTFSWCVCVLQAAMMLRFCAQSASARLATDSQSWYKDQSRFMNADWDKENTEGYRRTLHSFLVL